MAYGFLGLNQHIAIDLGTATTKVFLRGKGILIDEPTVAAFNRETGEVIAIGEKANKMLGRNPGGIEVVRPLADGVISEFDVTEKLLRHYIKTICGDLRIFKPVVMVSVPARMTDVEARAVVDACDLAGAREVYLISEPVASAIGSGLDISKPHGIMVVDIGGGTTDIAVITLNGISATNSVNSAGNRFDNDIIKYIQRRFKLIIGAPTAERVKREVGCAFYNGKRRTTTVKGRNFITGIPQAIEVGNDMLAEALSDAVSIIVDATKSVLERTPPELINDIKTDGILLSGGGSMLDGLDEYMSLRLNTPVLRALSPKDAVILGAAKALDNIDKFTPGARGYIDNVF